MAVIDANQIDVTTHEGIRICLSLNSGLFYARPDPEEDGVLWNESLKGLCAALDRLKTAENKRAREQVEPVPIVHLERKASNYILWSGIVTGLVAGRIHTVTLKSKNSGQLQLSPGRFKPLHPDDKRVEELAQLCSAMAALTAQRDAVEKSIEVITATIDQVLLPRCATKEEALEAEPRFLDKLRALVPQTK